ncbi:MAG: type I-E CRISPR-associated protein Cas5/CasD [Anaerolineae bacterium]|nr:type I-E CRISPR-associated protein Cas5/CasD [Anaerolineae bacterium]
MANTLFLRLEGPLQSWGERAKWDVRDTAPEPTKSGVVGLLACALGWNTDEDLRALSQQICVGVRCDQPGTLLRDYHTIVSGIISEGKIKRNAKTGEPETLISHRSYLCDASFLAAVQAAPELIDRLAWAVQNPVWALYLGRKACPASCPPFEGSGDYPTLEAALMQWPWYRWDVEPHTIQARAVLANHQPCGARRRDEIVSRSRRTYAPRYTYDVSITVQVQPIEPTGLLQGDSPCTSPA